MANLMIFQMNTLLSLVDFLNLIWTHKTLLMKIVDGNVYLLKHTLSFIYFVSSKT